MSSIVVERETLHQLIDDLPEKQLEELIEFATRLLTRTHPSNVLSPAIEVINLHETESTVNTIIRQIKNTPPNIQTITLPTKTWADYVAEIGNSQPTYKIGNLAAWNQTWDTIEANMKTQSLLHERNEYEEDWK